MLGNSNNKTDFFENKQSIVPDIKEWAVEDEEMERLNEDLRSTTNDLELLLEDQNKVAKLKEKLSKLEVEQIYCNENFKAKYVPVSKFSFYKKWSSNLILDFIAFYESIVFAHSGRKFSVKTLLFIKYGIYKFIFVNENQNGIISSLKRDYYKIAIEEIKLQITMIDRKLENKSFSKLIEQYSGTSERIFRGMLHKNYSKRAKEKYTIKSFKFNFKNFIDDYPVILSTTHSIMNSISENFLFDYLIIDEASQVDLVTASLAMACCKNAVIVGDVNQLPQIVGNDIVNISNELFCTYNIGEFYNYTKYSIIASLMYLYKGELPKTLLNEHYRCHPKIIGFCNEKFYDGKLVIMTDERSNDTPLKIYKTAPGNHARKDNFDTRKGWLNIRQIEVIRDEIINADKDKYGDCGLAPKLWTISPNNYEYLSILILQIKLHNIYRRIIIPSTSLPIYCA